MVRNFLCRIITLTEWLHNNFFNEFYSVGIVALINKRVECNFHYRGAWFTFRSIFCKVLNTSMIVYHSLNVTISSPPLKLKLLVVVKSRVISLCRYFDCIVYVFVLYSVGLHYHHTFLYQCWCQCDVSYRDEQLALPKFHNLEGLDYM